MTMLPIKRKLFNSQHILKNVTATSILYSWALMLSSLQLNILACFSGFGPKGTQTAQETNCLYDPLEYIYHKNYRPSWMIFLTMSINPLQYLTLSPIIVFSKYHLLYAQVAEALQFIELI